MSIDAVGGWMERSAVLFFNPLVWFPLARVWIRALCKLISGCRSKLNSQRPEPLRNTAVRLVTFISPKGSPGSYSGVQELKRRWMAQALGMLPGIATTQFVTPVFFVTSERTHL